VDCRLVVLDLDGTLLDREKNIPSGNLAALRRAAKAGAVLVPASGRSWAGIPACVRELPFFRYFITCNGASVYDRAAERELWGAPIPAARAEQVLAALGEMDGIPDLYADGGGFIEASSLASLDALCVSPLQAAYIRASRRPVPSLRQALREVRSVQLLQILLRDPSQKPRLIAGLRAQFPELNVVTSIDNNIELNAQNATKGEALLALCRLLEIPPAQTAAFGDEKNDVPMLRAAGLGVAMGNAQPEARAAAGLVTGTNEECGVAQALLALFPGG